jgi:hypothetical protein
MAVTNLLKPQVDLPVFEWMRFAPTATTSSSALASSDEPKRYMYYLVGQSMWRYDTYSDSWQECAPPINTVSGTALKYSHYSGHRGHTIGATSNTITISGFGKHSHLVEGLKIRIIHGKGAGQERTITEVADAITHDFGVVTSASSASIADSTKKWRVNQWDGYQCRLVYSTGSPQLRKILYNDTTTLYFNDVNHQAIDPANNTGWSVASPNAVPVSTAGSQTHFVIESSVATVDSPWTVVPDESSIYMIMSGGLWFLTGTSSTGGPFDYYDILTDTWYNRTRLPTGLLLIGSWANDFAIERTGEVGGYFVSGLTATSGAAYSITNSSAGMSYDRWSNYQIRIVSGTGVGQRKRIVGNTDTTFYVDNKWQVTPDSTSVYSILGDTDKIWTVGNATSVMFYYSVEKDNWAASHISDAGIARNISVTPYAGASYDAPHEGYGVSSIVYNANGILTVAVNAAGTNYVVGDLVTLSTTGSGAQVYVTGVTGGGAVTSVQLASSGTNYTSVTTSNTTGGSGSGLNITTTVGKVGNVTTATNHDFRHGESVTIAGCATDTTFNGTFQIIGTSALTTFSIANPSGTASPTASSSQSTSILVDASQNWNTNELTGRILYVYGAGPTPSLTYSRKIASNTATTITVTGSSVTAATNGTSRYVIAEPHGFGAMVTDKRPEKLPYGWATSGTSTTLVDSSKDWVVNRWVNCRVRIVCGTGTGNESVVTANTGNTLTVASWGVATPDSTSKYEILDSYGIITSAATSSTQTDANKNWVTNSLAGKRFRIIAGSSVGFESSITSNTATTITLNTSTTTEAVAGNGSMYVIYEIPNRGNIGIDLRWLYGVSDTAKKGRWLIYPRIGATVPFDLYDIPTNTWDIAPFIQPIATTLTTGTMYAYDGHDSYFFTKDATGRIYEINLDTFEIHAAGTTPYAHGTAVAGNRMEVVETEDGLKYLYVMRHSGQEMWRTLKFW